jgi:uncharacterized ferritin-like protein (DUF455 family)
MIVQAHKEIERYEISCDSEEELKNAKIIMTKNEGFSFVKEWLAPYEGEITWFALFEKQSRNYLMEYSEEEFE